MKQPAIKISFAFFLFLLAISSCKEVVIDDIYPDDLFSPYDTIDYTGNAVTPVIIDSASFLGLHTFIMQSKCAQPACHDGSFAPDYRTLNSSYNTLVYAQAFKDYLNPQTNENFQFRVVPGDTMNSFLWERLTTKDQVLGWMPLYDTLYPKEVNLIRDWILDGAKDFYGNSPLYPDNEPVSFGFIAYLPDFGNLRVDTIHYNNYVFYPMVLPDNVNVTIYFGIYDLDIDGNYVAPLGFSVNEVQFSVNEPEDHSNATTESLTVIPFPYMGPFPFTPNGNTAPYFHSVTINTAQYDVGDIVYMRLVLNDNDHVDNTEIPSAGSQTYLYPYWSFIIQ